MLNSVLTARLILNLREATPRDPNLTNTNANGINTSQQAQRANSTRWEMRTIDRIADDFEDASDSTSRESYIMDTVRRIKAQP